MAGAPSRIKEWRVDLLLVTSATRRASAALAAVASVALVLVGSAYAETRIGQGSKPSDQPPALDGSFVGDLQQVRITYDSSGTLTATVRFYQPIPSQAWRYGLEVKVGEGPTCVPAVMASEAIGTATPNPFPGQEFWVEVAGYQGGTSVAQTISADMYETSFTFSNPAIANRDFRCASADIFVNGASYDNLPTFYFDGYAPPPPPSPVGITVTDSWLNTTQAGVDRVTSFPSTVGQVYLHLAFGSPVAGSHALTTQWFTPSGASWPGCSGPIGQGWTFLYCFSNVGASGPLGGIWQVSYSIDGTSLGSIKFAVSAPTTSPPTAPPPSPSPVTVRLSAGKVELTKAQAGKHFTASVVITQADTTKGVQGRVTCAARLGEKSLPALRHSTSVTGKASCTWRLPNNARGKRLTGAIAETYRSARVSRPFSAKVS